MKPVIPTARFICPNCPATARNISKTRRRFLRRHPALCQRYATLTKAFSKALGAGELVELECGHSVRLRRNRIASMPCEECKQSGAAKEVA